MTIHYPIESLETDLALPHHRDSPREIGCHAEVFRPS